MEEGKVPSSMAGSQDALLPTPIGLMVNQTIYIPVGLMVRIMQLCRMAYGMTLVLLQRHAAVNTTQP